MNEFEVILRFLKPIEHLILDDSISEVMVNGPDAPEVVIQRSPDYRWEDKADPNYCARRTVQKAQADLDGAQTNLRNSDTNLADGKAISR